MTQSAGSKEEFPVLLIYWTSMVAPDGVLYFFDDVYDRDPQVVESLAKPVQFDLPGA